jgi:hypothetical protein
MANVFRYRRGDIQGVAAPIASATVVQIGDMVYLDKSADPASTYIKPAADQTDVGSLAANQDEFADFFLGVATQASAAGDTEDVLVGTEGEWEFICAAAKFNIGDYVGPADGSPLENQTVIKVTDPALAIGRVAKMYTANTTSVLVRIKSAIMNGGIQDVPASSVST